MERNVFWFEFLQKFVHFFCVVVCVQELKQKLTFLRTTRFGEFVLRIFKAVADLLVKTSCLTAVVLMRIEVAHRHDLVAFTALYLQSVVNPFQCNTGHRMDVVSASVGAIASL